MAFLVRVLYFIYSAGRSEKANFNLNHGWTGINAGHSRWLVQTVACFFANSNWENHITAIGIFGTQADFTPHCLSHSLSHNYY